jgi:hypothetical protein
MEHYMQLENKLFLCSKMRKKFSIFNLPEWIKSLSLFDNERMLFTLSSEMKLYSVSDIRDRKMNPIKTIFKCENKKTTTIWNINDVYDGLHVHMFKNLNIRKYKDHSELACITEDFVLINCGIVCGKYLVIGTIQEIFTSLILQHGPLFKVYN